MLPVEALSPAAGGGRGKKGPASRPGILSKAGCPPRLVLSLESDHNGSWLIFSRRTWSGWDRAETATVSLPACMLWGVRIRTVRFW
jgi:hypothetical protein